MINKALSESQGPISPKVTSLVDLFVSSLGAGRRFLLGRNEYSAMLSTVFDIDGFVDDFAESNMIWNGKPVIKGSNVPKEAIVVNCSMSISPVSAHKRITNLSVFGVLSYSDFCKALPDLVPLPKFVLETQIDILQNQIKWLSLIHI